MGFKDAERAYAVMSITGTPKVVLAALAHRADDRTHRTIVGQDTLASMTGQGVKTVQRALGVLEASGLITRQARFRKDGPRTSDEITLTLDVTNGQIDRESDSPEVLGDELTTGQIDHKSDSPRPTVNGSSTNGQIVPAYKDGHSVGHSVGHSDTPIPPSNVVAIIDRFDEFWAAWPRKVGKPTAQRAWVKASKRADPFRIVEAALGYAANPHRPDAEFIPHPSTWLNRDGWDDELPGPRSNGRPTPTQRAASIAQAGQNLMDQRRGLAPVTTLNPKGISS